MRLRGESGLLFSRLSRDLGASGKSAGQPEAATVEKADPTIICRACGADITKPVDAMAVAGAHRHTFANPYGNVFDIGCFRNAPGCAHIGPATDDFTWFSGYRWRIAICGACHEHLGWRYERPGVDVFYGLIINQLIFPS